MISTDLAKAGIVATIITIIFFALWENHLRKEGVKISYDDGASLWADKRAMVYEPLDKATVFVGSSRNKYALDIDTWQQLTGDHAIQLAIEGNSPLPVLNDLADDKNFKGKLVVDVTEGLFFTTSPHNITEPADRVAYYKKRTPAQRASFLINKQLESRLVFLDKDYFSLNALLNELPVARRTGVFSLPHDCPRDFKPVTFDRQNIMTDRFVADTNIQNKVKELWTFYRKISTEPPAGPAKIDSILSVVKKATDKIESRGGKVIFLRTPSSGPYLMGEEMAFPRNKYWDKILTVTGKPGIHFKDYPAISNFVCPEFSHLKHSDAIIFTKNLIQILQEKGWTFRNKETASL